MSRRKDVTFLFCYDSRCFLEGVDMTLPFKEEKFFLSLLWRLTWYLMHLQVVYCDAHLIWLCLYIYLREAPSFHSTNLNQNSLREIITSIRVSPGILFEHPQLHHHPIWQNAAITRFRLPSLSAHSSVPPSSPQSVSVLNISLQLISKHARVANHLPPGSGTQDARLEFIHQNFSLWSLEHARWSIDNYKWKCSLLFLRSTLHMIDYWLSEV